MAFETPFRAGALRHRMAVEAFDITRGAGGSEVKTPRLDFWIQVEFLSQNGREYFQARAVNAAMTHLLRARWRDGLVPSKRLRYPDPKTKADRYFDIQAVTNSEELKHAVQLQCRELIGREIQT